MKNKIFALLVASVFCGLYFPALAFADPGHDCDTKITSSMIAEPGIWLVSGDCLQNVTNVGLARDFGDGFENLDFDKQVDGATGNTFLVIPMVPRMPGEIGGIPIGQYLLQLSKCETKGSKTKCHVLDEKYLFAASCGVLGLGNCPN